MSLIPVQPSGRALNGRSAAGVLLDRAIMAVGARLSVLGVNLCAGSRLSGWEGLTTYSTK